MRLRKSFKLTAVESFLEKTGHILHRIFFQAMKNQAMKKLTVNTRIIRALPNICLSFPFVSPFNRGTLRGTCHMKKKPYDARDVV